MIVPREIKFRAWDKQDKRMITDEQSFIPLKVTNKGVLRLSHVHPENLWEIMNGERFEIMQYTGLKDEEGTEMYEGDLVQKDGVNFVVEWGHTGWYATGTKSRWSNFDPEIFVVVGNKYNFDHLLIKEEEQT